MARSGSAPFALALVALGACGRHAAQTPFDASNAQDLNEARNGADAREAPGQREGGRPDPFLCIPDASPPGVATVHIGPDITVDVACGSQAQVPIASLTNSGNEALSWWTTRAAPEAFGLPEEGVTCPSDGVMVVFVTVTAPDSAIAGDTFDGTFTLNADHGEFPSGTVTVHARVVMPAFTIEPAELDFGDVPEGERIMRTVTFRNESTSPLWVGLISSNLPPSSRPFQPGIGQQLLRPLSEGPPVSIFFGDALPGDYSGTLTWYSPAPGLKGPESFDPLGPCQVTSTIKLRGHIVGRDGGFDVGVRETGGN